MRIFQLLIHILLLCTSLTAQVSRELYRPIFHYSPSRNWMNDPNGPVYYNNKYHLFYQYNPLGIQWGNISWGHAISDDLINWEEKPVAIPAHNGIEIFSGSIVVDWNNTSDFGINNRPPLVAIYTGSTNVQDQRIAYSNDEGLTWTNYDHNPVINSSNSQFRDPKVFWHNETQKWIMVVGLGYNNKIRFYNSPDLKNWTWLEDFGPVENISGFWECPDFFKLAIDNDASKTKWVLIHSLASLDQTQYFIGDFDGHHFKWESPPPAGIIIDDFESGFNNWAVTGTAFGTSPATGNLGIQRTVSGYLGDHLVNSFQNDFAAQGKMISQDFIIQKKYISFLIGGGNQPSAYIKLVINGQTIRTSTGNRDEFLKWKNWNVSSFIGRTAHIEIVDSSISNWGYILIDHIIQSDVMVDKINTGQLDHGKDFYASQSFSDIPETDGRRIWIGWMNNWSYATVIPTSPWKGIMSIPREVKLETHNSQIKLVQTPVKELNTLRSRHLSFTKKDLNMISNYITNETNDLLNNSAFKQFELKAKIPVLTQKGFSLIFKKRGAEFSEYIFDFDKREIRFDRSKSGQLINDPNFINTQIAPLIVENGYIDIDLFVDNCSAELFSANGQVVMSNQIFPDSTSNKIELKALDENIVFENFDLWQLGKEQTANTTVLNNSMIRVYPNPITGNDGLRINVRDDLIGKIRIKLYDVTGKFISEFQPSSNFIIIPKTKFGNSTGSFFLTATDGYSIQTERLIVVGQ